MEASALTTRVRAAAIAGRSPLLRLQSDERLIELTRRGNDHAFEVLVRRYQPRLLAFCRHMLGSREDAEDVLQEVFAAAYNAVLADERPINTRPWLYRIARNRCLNHLRRPQAQAHESMAVFDRSDGASAADTVVEREEFRNVLADVQELPETQRTALLLREIDALSYEQIAEAMETTVPSVKSLLVRARMALAEAAEARLLTCDEVRVALARDAEGLEALPPPVRRHLRRCERCRAFRSHLRETSKALALLFPAGPLFALKQLVFGKLLGGGAASGSAVGGAAASGTGSMCGAAGAACSAGTTAVTAAGAGTGAVGIGTAAGGVATSALSAGISTFASKAAAATAAATVVAVGAIEIGHGTRPLAKHRAAAPQAEASQQAHANRERADQKAAAAAVGGLSAGAREAEVQEVAPVTPGSSLRRSAAGPSPTPAPPPAAAGAPTPAPPIVERVHETVTLPPEPSPPATVTIEQPPVAGGSAGDSQYAPALPPAPTPEDNTSAPGPATSTPATGAGASEPARASSAPASPEAAPPLASAAAPTPGSSANGAPVPAPVRTP